MGLFDELKGDQAEMLKPGMAGKAAIERELETWRDQRPLKGTGYAYRNGGDWLLKHGRFYQGRELPDEYDHLVGESARCFKNAMEACEADPSLRYCEGIYSTGGFHFTNHGWCVDANDEVVELTYPTKDLDGALDARGGPILPPEHWSYFGVIVPVELARWHTERIGLPMLERPPGDKRLGAWEFADGHDFPVLRVPYDPARTDLDGVPYTSEFGDSA